LPKAPDARPLVAPEIRSDRGSGSIFNEFRMELKGTEENDLVEQSNQMLCEGHEGEELTNHLELERVLTRLRWR